MADNLVLNSGTGGGTAATDLRTIDSVAVHVQRVASHGAPGLTVGQVEVSSAATAIAAARDTRQSLTIVNRELASVYVADSTAVSTASFRLDPGDSVTWAVSGAVYAITAAAYTATGDAKVHVAETHD